MSSPWARGRELSSISQSTSRRYDDDEQPQLSFVEASTIRRGGGSPARRRLGYADEHSRSYVVDSPGRRVASPVRQVVVTNDSVTRHGRASPSRSERIIVERDGRSYIDDSDYNRVVVPPRGGRVQQPRTVRVVRREVSRGDSSHSYAAPTYTSSRKAVNTMPTKIRIAGLRGIGSKANGDYKCIKALDAKAARRSTGPSVVYEKSDGSGPEQLVYEKHTWAIISSQNADGSLGFAEVDMLTSPCLIPESNWRVSNGSEERAEPSSDFVIEDSGVVGIAEPQVIEGATSTDEDYPRDGVVVRRRVVGRGPSTSAVLSPRAGVRQVYYDDEVLGGEYLYGGEYYYGGEGVQSAIASYYDDDV
eukprot:COSAG05_NODE_4939_length_1319_cov_1.038525_1_plen_360_part_10